MIVATYNALTLTLINTIAKEIHGTTNQSGSLFFAQSKKTLLSKRKYHKKQHIKDFLKYWLFQERQNIKTKN